MYADLFCRSPQPMAARPQIKYQRTAVSIHAQGLEFIDLLSGKIGCHRSYSQYTTEIYAWIQNATSLIHRTHHPLTILSRFNPAT
jgi:hypothetical protein